MSIKIHKSSFFLGVLWGLILLSAILMAAAVWMTNKEVHQSFKESKRTIANPDRGFYIQIRSSSPHRIAEASKEVRVILLAFDLESYEGEDLPEEKLEELRLALEAAVRNKVAVIFRAAYGFQKNAAEPERLEQMGRHIRQISEILNQYPEQILAVQAGMLGAYGEWHSSRYLEGSEEENKENRLYLLRQWEKYLNSDIKVAVRRPRFVREAEKEGVLTGRLGVHNDALLSTESDMGTYDDPGVGRQKELAWSDRMLCGQVNGGEMPAPGELNAPENAHYEFGLLHLSYLNLKYNEDIISQWSGQTMEGTDAKTYIENHLGYRLFLSEISARPVYVPWKIFHLGDYGSMIQLRMTFCNTGYSPLPEKYRVYVTVETEKDIVYHEAEISELHRISNGQNVTKELVITIPKEFLDQESVRNGEETITVGLKLAPGSGISDGLTCVELANDSFLYKNGINKILRISKERKRFTECELYK